MRALWRWVPDPADAEYVRAPRLQIQTWLNTGVFEGDCDDAATLAAALLAAIDWPSTLIAVRMANDSEFSHVFLRAPMLEYAPAEVWDIDPTTAEQSLPIRNIAESMEVPI